MIRFSIVIVTYNSQRQIKNCLDSIIKQNFGSYEIIIVDNASLDKTCEILNEYKINARVKYNDKNFGFSDGVNAGISMSTGEYILTLNPDVVLDNNFLLEVNNGINKLKANVGMLGVKILKADSERLIDSTGLVLTRCFRFFDRGQGEEDTGQYDKNTEILGPCGAAAIYKRVMLDDVKIDQEYFDKDFFYLIEDFDIALRAKKNGWKGFYLSNAVCFHKRNGSGMTYKCRQYYAFRNRYFLIIKNIKIEPFFIVCFLIYDIGRFIFLLLFNNNTIRALKEIKKLSPEMLKKRKIIWNKVNLSL